MPNDNTVAEREFAKLDQTAGVAKYWTKSKNYILPKTSGLNMMMYKSSNQIVKKAAKERIFLEQYPKGNTGQKYLKIN